MYLDYSSSIPRVFYGETRLLIHPATNVLFGIHKKHSDTSPLPLKSRDKPSTVRIQLNISACPISNIKVKEVSE